MWYTYISRAVNTLLCGKWNQAYCARVAHRALMTDMFFWRVQERILDALFMLLLKERRHCWRTYLIEKRRQRH